MIKTCPTCGAITEERQFSTPFRQEIYDFIRLHPGCTMESIVNHVYRNDPSGGASTNSVAVIIRIMRKELQELGYTISTRHGRGAGYRLVELKDQ